MGGQPQTEALPDWSVTVDMEARVTCQHEGRDPGFAIQAPLNRQAFVSEDTAQIFFQANRAGFLSVFILMADNRVRCLVGCRPGDQKRFGKGEAVTFPEPAVKTLVIATLPEHKVDHEAFLVMATKTPADFSLLFGSGEDAELTEFLRELVRIPIDQRQEKILIYEVRAE